MFSGFSFGNAYGETTDHWVTKASMTIARSGNSTVVLNGKIYAIGGSRNNGMLSSVEEFVPISNSWTNKANMNVARAGNTSIVLNNKIYAVDGSDVKPSVEQS